MKKRELGAEAGQALQQVLGYLNFSQGAPDTQFLRNLNLLFAETQTTGRAAWDQVSGWCLAHLTRLSAESPAFQNVDQARAVLLLFNEHVLPGYWRFHADLLGHHVAGEVWNGFFAGKVLEAILRTGPPWHEAERIASTAIRSLNDFIGYRPVATLESQKIEPYAHEWVRPIPLFIAGAGVAHGPHETVVARCLQILGETPADILREACFDLNLLDELALDPRAYDFDHPVNKRPNYHFGQWDPHLIDNRGFYRRFVVQQVTFDSLLNRALETRDLPTAELLEEAAAVLAGTILMAAGISGAGPGTYDSSVSLAALLPRIAAYRDAFYEQLGQRLQGSHGARLREETKRLQQPFGGARQDLNRALTKLRATQMSRVQLAKVFARMGYAPEASEQVALINVPSARMACKIDCLLTDVDAALRRLDAGEALRQLSSVRDVVRCAIECGAFVDPWNILGFDGNFSLFPAIDNSIRDHRVDELIELLELLFHLHARLWSSAAANDEDELASQAAQQFHELALWWHQFAVHEISIADTEDPLQLYAAAEHVADSLKRWHHAGAASGDIAFWAPLVDDFDSCRAYELVIDTLLARQDHVAALGLLMHWLSQSHHIPLEKGETSFHRLMMYWHAEMLQRATLPPSAWSAPTLPVEASPEAARGNPQLDDQIAAWGRIRKSFDYLEANAGEYWRVPTFDIAPDPHLAPDEETERSDRETDDAEDPEHDLFRAAYENVVFRDSTDDGIEGNIFDFDEATEDQLQLTSQQVVRRLGFLDTLAGMWKLTAVAWSAFDQRTSVSPAPAEPGAPEPAKAALDRSESAKMAQQLAASAHLARAYRGDLNALLESVSRYKLIRPTGDSTSMVQYDRLRLIKESLLENIINVQVSMAETEAWLRASLGIVTDDSDGSRDPMIEMSVVRVLQAAFRNDVKLARSCCPEAIRDLLREPILYVPLSRGGSARAIMVARARQVMVSNLLQWLPRLGMLGDTFELIETARRIERLSPVGPGAVTEFDDLFEIACSASVAMLARTAETQRQSGGPLDNLELNNTLEELIEPLLQSWLAHSRTLRLSVLEQVADDDEWKELVEFITHYGRSIFTQRFLNLGNVRGILHQGVAHWIDQLLKDDASDEYQEFIDALQHDLDRDVAVEKMTIILEAIVENYAEYRDYNSTTTQSDRGDLLYTLLDFLRLRTSYDRVVWNLRPIVIAHQILVTHNCEEAAEMWRHSLQERIDDEAKRHVRRLASLQSKYAMRLPSVLERISERFMRPLIVDRLCALIEPAMTADDPVQRASAFAVIREGAEMLSQEPCGAGLDMPAWLVALEDEVRRVGYRSQTDIARLAFDLAIPPQTQSLQTIRDQVATYQKKQKRPS